MFTEDLDAFLNTNEHAVAATYNGAAAVSVIFDNDFLRSVGMVDTTNPVAIGKASDFPVAGSPVGKTLAIGSTTYTIRSYQPMDDGAFVALQLEAA